MAECKYLDPLCPCQDGDACHYEAVGGTPAWPAPMECRDCDNIETDPIFLDTETCSKCGGFLSAVDMDDDN